MLLFAVVDTVAVVGVTVAGVVVVTLSIFC